MQIRTTLSTPGDDAGTAPRLLLGEEAWLKMRVYALSVRNPKGYNVEINGFGYVTRQGDGSFYCYDEGDVFITKQVVTGSAATSDNRAHAKAQYRARQVGRDQDLRLQWHSHVWGTAYHSLTDKAAIEHFGRNGVEWFISVVITNNGEVTARLDQFQGIRLGAPMEVILVQSVPDDTVAGVEDEIEELVTIKQEKPVKGSFLSGIVHQS